MNLSKNVKISTAITVTNGAAATSAIEGTVLDMKGFEGVLMVVQMGAIEGSATTSIKARSGTDDTVTDAADLLGTSQTISDGDDEDVFYIDLYKPVERYVQLYVTRGVSNATLSANYIQYGPALMPTTHGDIVNGETHISPAEGTA